MSSVKKWRVGFTRSAENDIHDILVFIADQDGPETAELILEKFIKARDTLQILPERGRIPPELLQISVLSFREIQIPPYRMIYNIDRITSSVNIHIVVDGRRNFTEIIKEHLLNINNEANIIQ